MCEHHETPVTAVLFNHSFLSSSSLALIKKMIKEVLLVLRMTCVNCRKNDKGSVISTANDMCQL